MRRLVHLLSDLDDGGKERVAIELARHGRRQGHDHCILLFDRPPDPEHGLDPGEIPWELIRRGPGLDLRFVARLRRYIARHHIEVIHAHNDSALVYAVLASRSMRQRPRVIGTFHTRPSHPTRARRWLNRQAGRFANAVSAVRSRERRARIRDLHDQDSPA